jgi:hypothetical protein
MTKISKLLIFLQAMLRKTNINRSSLRRTYDTTSESVTREIPDQEYSKDYFSNEKYNLRSSSTPYSSSNTSNHTNSMSYIGKYSSQTPSNENEHRNKKYPESSCNDNEEQDGYNSMISWNDTENSPNSKISWTGNEEWARLDPKKSQAKNEQYKYEPMKSDYMNKNRQHRMEISKKCWNESKLGQSECMKFQKKGEHFGRFDTKEYSIQNEQQKSNNKTDLKKLSSEHEHQTPTRTRMQWEDKTGLTVTELVPGLIIKGKIADL